MTAVSYNVAMVTTLVTTFRTSSVAIVPLLILLVTIASGCSPEPDDGAAGLILASTPTPSPMATLIPTPDLRPTVEALAQQRLAELLAELPTPERASIRCWVRTSRTPFFFEKTLTLTSGSNVLEVDQALTNEGEEKTHCVWGEHIALGPPFLSEDCVIDLPGGTFINHPTEFHPNNRLKADIQTAWPMTQAKDGSEIDASKIPPKSIRAYDMSYISDMPEGWYAVTNQRLGVGFGVHFPTDVYRFLWYWQSFGGSYGYPFWGRTYNVGLEPFSSYTNEGLANAIDNGTAMELEPGERVESSLKVVAYSGSERVTRIRPDGSVERA